MIEAKRLIRLEGGVGDDCSEKKVGSERRVDEDRVLSDPAQPGPLGVIALQYGSVVHVGARVHLSSANLAQRFGKLLELFLEDRVVITAAGVAGDDGTCRVVHRSVVAVVVVHRDDDDRARPRKHRSGVDPPLHRVGPGEIGHFAGMAALQPLQVEVGVGRPLGRGNANELEAQLGGAPLDQLAG